MFNLSLKKKPAYIHVPKTGGTYLGQLESENSPVITGIKYLGHCTLINDKLKKKASFPPKIGYVETATFSEKIKNKHYLFSTVRNPYDWLVSYWNHSGGYTAKYANCNHYDYKNSRRGFEYLVKTIANRDGDIWPSRKFIFFALFSYSGDFLPKWICRTESLDKDLHDLAKYKGLKYKKKEKQRISMRKRNYKHYYNDNLIGIVEKTWKRELKLYGYDYNGLDISRATIKRKVNKHQQKKIKYSWETNKLIIRS